MDKPKDIELRSEKIKNIIGQIPPLLIRYGNSILCFVFLLLIILATCIPFPHKVNMDIYFELDKMEETKLSAIIFVPSNMILQLQRAKEIRFSLDIYQNDIFVPTKIDSISLEKRIFNQDLYQKIFVAMSPNTFDKKQEICGLKSLLKGKLILSLPPETFAKRFYK